MSASHPCTLVLCGQTNAGKSTVAGHLMFVLSELGCFEDEPTLQSELRDAVKSNSDGRWSRMMDAYTGDIEAVHKSRTMEFIEYSFELAGTHYTIVDTPGHQLLITTMIDALLSRPRPADYACIVLSSIEKEFIKSFERGTTKEDILIARASGCRRLMLVWNKTDVATPTKAMRENIRAYARPMFTCEMREAYVSGVKGTNLRDILWPESVRKRPAGSEARYMQRITIGRHSAFRATLCFVCNPCRTPITRGMMITLHTQGGEIRAHVEGLSKGGKAVRMARFNTPYDVQLVSADGPIDTGIRVIARYDTITFGFGEVRVKRTLD